MNTFLSPLLCIFHHWLLSELFTNCLDMLSTLLHSLPTDFHITLAGSGEEGKKPHTACIKKLKADLGSAKSACLSEIQQLFPLAQRPYEIITVKPPAFNIPKATGEKIVVRALYMHGHVHVLMIGRKKEASKVKQTTRQSNTAHPRQ